jgi:hypothetical protein
VKTRSTRSTPRPRERCARRTSLAAGEEQAELIRKRLRWRPSHPSWRPGLAAT